MVRQLSVVHLYHLSATTAVFISLAAVAGELPAFALLLIPAFSAAFALLSCH